MMSLSQFILVFAALFYIILAIFNISIIHPLIEKPKDYSKPFLLLWWMLVLSLSLTTLIFILVDHAAP